LLPKLGLETSAFTLEPLNFAGDPHALRLQAFGLCGRLGSCRGGGLRTQPFLLLVPRLLRCTRPLVFGGVLGVLSPSLFFLQPRGFRFRGQAITFRDRFALALPGVLDLQTEALTLGRRNCFRLQPLLIRHSFGVRNSFGVIHGSLSRGQRFASLRGVGRRVRGSTTWSTVKVGHTLRYDDSHNVISMGVSKVDGRLHLNMDSHSDGFTYVKSVAGLMDDPGGLSWTASRFGAPQSTLDGLALTSQFTYPQFISTPEGRLQLSYRGAVSGNARRCGRVPSRSGEGG